MSARTVLVALLAVACNDATLTRGRTAPTVSIRSPADGAGYVEGEPITVVAKVDDDQSPASDLDYAWTADGFALDGEDTLEDAEVTFVLPEGLDAGEHTIRVEVTDPDAMSGDDEVTVRVAANEVPTLAFLAPEEGGRVFDNQPVTVSLQVADADADDLSRHVLTWTGLDADPPAPDADGLATTEVGPLAVGDYEIDATVTDPGGETAGASVRFTVAPADADDDGHDDVDAGGDDCDDADPEVYGGGEEACNGEDDNCDGIVPGDETDADGDGWMICEGDCDDDNLDVHPEAGEICDGLDDDCDGQTPDDEADADGDGWRACAGDCDDGDALVSPDDVELCNGWDDDCDGTVDGADAVDASTWYTDADADEWGDPASPVVACEQPADAVADATDCNDADDAVNPAATEACNGVDDDCDGTIDEDGATGSVVYYADTDGDGYGDPDTTAALCSPASGWVSDVLDCDDTEATVNPASTEVCDDGLDNDCDGTGNACGLGGEEGPGDALGVLVGVNSYGDVGGSVAGLPDFDGDGYGDILVGDPLYDGSRSNSGAAWIFLGAPSGEEWISGAHLMLEGSGTGDDAGTTVAYVGDLDRDGLSDAMIGAPDASGAGSGSGSAYLVYGGAAAGTLDLGSADAELRGETKNDAAGSALAGPGDVDGDGADDVMVGAPHESSVGTNSGAAYVFGGPVYGTFDLAGADLVLRGEATGDRAGYAVAGADLDGDGLSDLLVGAEAADAGGTESGASYLVLGGASGSLSLSAAEAKIAGAASYDGVGAALAAMGDVDGDGREDFAVGAPDAGSSAQAGAVYVFFTLPSGSASVTDADVAVTGAASYDRLGLSIFGGDVDGDGLSDLVAGADGEDTAGLGAGAALLWYGPLGASTPDATLIPDAANDDAGTSVGGADLDGNGAVDPLVGAPGNDRGATSAGALFVFGGGGI